MIVGKRPRQTSDADESMEGHPILVLWVGRFCCFSRSEDPQIATQKVKHECGHSAVPIEIKTHGDTACEVWWLLEWERRFFAEEAVSSTCTNY